MTTWLLICAFFSAINPAGQYVEITEPDRAAFGELSRNGFVIDRVDGDTVRLHVLPGELERLRERGYTPRLLPDTTPAAKAPGAWHDFAGFESELVAYAAAYPDITALSSIGVSVNGRPLYLLRITDNPDTEEAEPEFKYIGAIHGDESLGSEMLLYFIDYLLSEYSSNSRVRHLVDETDISILLVMNPDGLEAGTRRNTNDIDLNRDFPVYPTEYSGTLWDEGMSTAGAQAETGAVMQWSAANSFVLSANFHTGERVVNYPYDEDGRGSTDSPTPDDLLIEALSRRYALNNPAIRENPDFPPDGISNGAAWYAIYGGMQDWNYRYTGCIEVTIEIWDQDHPSDTLFPQFWEDNREAMLRYLEGVHTGVRGIITDAETGEPVYARVLVTGNSQPVFSDPDIGDYYRLLLPGAYTLTCAADGYRPAAIDVTVPDTAAAVVRDITLHPESACPDCEPAGRTLLEVGEDACITLPDSVPEGVICQWRRQDSGPLEEGRYQGVACRTLYIPILQPGDSGVYECEWRTADGTQTGDASFRVTVAETVPVLSHAGWIVLLIVTGLCCCRALRKRFTV
jgi:hypothetical protein